MAQCGSELPRMPAFDRARRSFQQRYAVSEDTNNEDYDDGAPFSEALEARNSRNGLPSLGATSTSSRITTSTTRRVLQEPGLAALRSLSDALHEMVSSSVSSSTGSPSSLNLYRCMSSCVFDSLSELRAGCLLGTPVWPAVLLKAIDSYLLGHANDSANNDGGSNTHRSGGRLVARSQAAVIEDDLKTLAEFASSFQGENLSQQSRASTQEWPVLAMAGYEFGLPAGASMSHDWSATGSRRSSLDRVVLIRLGNGIACDCHLRDLLSRLLGPITSVECPKNENSTKNNSELRSDCDEKSTPLTPPSGGVVGTTPLSSEVNNSVGEGPAQDPEWAFVELPSVGAAQRAVRLLEDGLDLTPLGGPKHALSARLFRGYGTPASSSFSAGAGLGDRRRRSFLGSNRDSGDGSVKEEEVVAGSFYDDDDEDDDVIVAGDEDDVEDIVLEDEELRQRTSPQPDDDIYDRRRPQNAYEEFEVHNDDDEEESEEDEVVVGSEEEEEDFGGRGPLDSLAPVVCLVCGADYEATSNYASHCASRRHTDALQRQETRRSPRGMRNGRDSANDSAAIAAAYSNSTKSESFEPRSSEMSSRVLPPDLPSLSPQDLPPLSPPDLPSLSERRHRHHYDASVGASEATAASPRRSDVSVSPSVVYSATAFSSSRAPNDTSTIEQGTNGTTAAYAESPGELLRTQEAARRMDEWRAAVKVFRGGQWVDSVVSSLEAAILEPGPVHAPARASAEAALTRAYAARLAASYHESSDEASESHASASGGDQAALERAAKLLLARPVQHQQEYQTPSLPETEAVEEAAGHQRASLLEEALLGERLRSAALMRTLRVTEKARATLVAQVLNGRSAASREVARATAAEAQASDLRAQVLSLQVALETAERRAEDARTSARASAQRARMAEAQTVKAEEQAAQAERRGEGLWSREDESCSANELDHQLTSALTLLEALGTSEESFDRRGAASQMAKSKRSTITRVNSEDCARAMLSALADDAFYASLSNRSQRRSHEGLSECKQHEEGSAASAAVAALERMEVGLQSTASLVRAEKEARSRRQLEVW